MLRKTGIALILAVILTAGSACAEETKSTKETAESQAVPDAGETKETTEEQPVLDAGETEEVQKAEETGESREAADETETKESEEGPAKAEPQFENLWITNPELMFQLNRSELDGLGQIEGKVYVFGHRSPDSDTVCSAIAYAYLLRQLGIDAEAAILEHISNETAFILRDAGIEAPPILEDASGQNVILVDHADYVQSAPGLEDARILSVVDHHGAGTVSTSAPLVYDARPIGATATILWMRYMNYNVPIDRQVAKIMLGALLSDTSNMKSETVTSIDREALKALSALAGVEDVKSYYDIIYKEALSYEGMADTEIFNNDLRSYESGGTKFLIGVVNVYDQEQAMDMAERMKAILPQEAEAAGVDMAFAQISIYHDDVSYNYIVPSDDAAAEAMKEAFGEEGKFDGTSFVFHPGFSRKKVLVPKLSDALALHPRE